MRRIGLFQLIADIWVRPFLDDRPCLVELGLASIYIHTSEDMHKHAIVHGGGIVSAGTTTRVGEEGRGRRYSQEWAITGAAHRARAHCCGRVAPQQPPLDGRVQAS